MTLAALEKAASDHFLENFGTLSLSAEDGIGTGSLVLIGPSEPGFWPHVTSQPEFSDGKADPLDRWSHRIISDLAATFGGQAAFPFGQPLRPFMTWALRSGRAWSSPVGILVHDQAGLMVSYRGAIALPDVTVTAGNQPRPCETCRDKPCLTACPAAALTGEGYDLPACHGFLDTPPGQSCLTQGCAVRRSCPQGGEYGRLEEQSAYHMGLFHR